MDSAGIPDPSLSPYHHFYQAFFLIPISHYAAAIIFISIVFIYNFLEIHFIRDFFTGFRGDSVSLTYNPCSELYQSVVSKCEILHGRYFATPWLSSPHLQTAFLSLIGKSPVFSYKRELFVAPDGGTIALDWLMKSDGTFDVDENNSEDGKTPIVIVIPGLTSDSDSNYIKHLAWKIASNGCNVVVSNHRGLGGISLTSDCFYNAGWTEDIRRVIGSLHCQYPKAPLYAVGTSIGANVLVKYLGEDGNNCPIVGAAAVCSPWDLLICDRFINRKLVQKFYNGVLTIGLQGYAQLHHSVLSRLADWESIKKSRSVRDFDNYATRVVGNYETVDTYYRHCSSVSFVRNISVPLLCISALDDPVCTREAIPWDECRANENIILATTQHGGHLALYEGITASSMWWIRAVDEFFHVLGSSPHIKKRKQMQIPAPPVPLELSIDHAPFVNVVGDGMVTAASNSQTNNSVEDTSDVHNMVSIMHNETISDNGKNDCKTEETHLEKDITQPQEKDVNEMTDPVRRCMNHLSRQNLKAIWLLAYIAIITTWPLVGSALHLLFKKKFKNFLPATFLRR